MWVPAAKVEKGSHTVNQEGLQYGDRRVPLLAIQQLAGILQSWLVVLPVVALESRVLYTATSSDDGLWCHPRGTPETL